MYLYGSKVERSIYNVHGKKVCAEQHVEEKLNCMVWESYRVKLKL